MLHRDTLLWFARNASDLFQAKWARLVQRSIEEASRIVLHADPRDLLADGWPSAAIDELLKWRIAREHDAEEKRHDERGSAELRIDTPQGSNPTK